MGGNRQRLKWTSFLITLLSSIVLVSQMGLIGVTADSSNETTRGSSELRWTQTTQADFEGGTSADVVVTQSGEVKLGLDPIDSNPIDDLNIDYERKVIVDTTVEEVGYASAYSILINRTFGGSREDYGHSVQQTSDGGYIIAGSTNSTDTGNMDVWLIKTDNIGNEQWNRTYGGSGWDYGIFLQLTDDNGYIITGFTESYGAGDKDVWLIKTDGVGNEQWNRTFGGTGFDMGLSVQQTSDKGYIMVGNYRGPGFNDAWLIKTNHLGIEQWNKTYDMSDSDVVNSVQQTADGGYIFAGSVHRLDAHYYDAWLVKTDSSGDEQWNRTFGGNEHDYGLSVHQTSDNGYILAGSTQSYGAGLNDAWLIKTDDLGYEQWNRTYGGIERDDYHWVQQTSDGGYLIAGETQSYGAGEMDVWLMKTDGLGNEQWNRTFGGGQWDVSSFHWFGHPVEQISDDVYVIVGTTQSFGAGDWDVWLIKAGA